MLGPLQGQVNGLCSSNAPSPEHVCSVMMILLKPPSHMSQTTVVDPGKSTHLPFGTVLHGRENRRHLHAVRIPLHLVEMAGASLDIH